MAKRSTDNAEEVIILLKHLLAIELWRAGLSQSAIRTRLGLGMNVVSHMLKGVNRHVDTQVRPD